MAACNEQRFIEEAMASVQAQTHLPLELIVVDDASTDRTSELARACDGPVPIKYIRLDARQGVVAARNRAIAEASGDWIAICDADDVWLPEKLERQFEFVAEWAGPKPLALVGTQGFHISETGRMAGLYDPDLDTFRKFRERFDVEGSLLMMGHSSVVFRRADFALTGGYDQDSLGAEDVEFFEHLATVTGGAIINLREPLYHYRKKSGGVSQAGFWRQQVTFGRILENRRRVLAGQAPMSHGEYEQQLRTDPWRVRLGRRWYQIGALYYRRGGTNLLNRRVVVGATQLAVASVARPSLVSSGVRRFYSRTARPA
jgi:glycosyltransferase involved in cell wall biosynthesis